MKRAWLLPLMFVLTSVAATADTGINTVVKVVEARYHVRHHGIPLLWMAKPFMIGSGAAGLKMAVFEDFRVPAADAVLLQKNVRQALGPEWFPFVETWSHADQEWSMIYVRPRGSKLQMLIVASDRDDCTVMQMHVSGTPRDEWFREPVKKAYNHKAGEAHSTARNGGGTTAAAQ